MGIFTMFCCEKEDETEIFTGITVPISLAEEAKKSICKIIINTEKGTKIGIGFFMKTDDSNYYFVTNFHILSAYRLEQNIEVEIYNKKRMNLKNLMSISYLRLDNYIKYFPQSKDIAYIKLEKNIEIFNDIKFLYYDKKSEEGYKKYIKANVFSFNNPLEENLKCSSGQIVQIDDYKFIHNISIDNNSSGCPIMLINDNKNEIRVIGISEGTNYSRKMNIGIFIGEIFKKKVDEIYMTSSDEEENKYCLLEPSYDIIYEELKINFISLNLNINYDILCERTDYFSKLEEKLYIEFPELRFKNLSFSRNGYEINRSFSIAENNILNNDQILVNEVR